MTVPKRSSIIQQQQQQQWPFLTSGLSIFTSNSTTTTDRTNAKRISNSSSSSNGKSSGVAFKSFCIFAIVVAYLNYRANDSISRTTQHSVHEHTTIVVERDPSSTTFSLPLSSSTAGTDNVKQPNLRSGQTVNNDRSGNSQTTNNEGPKKIRTLPQFPRRPYPPMVDNDMSDNPELQAEWSLWADKPMTGSFLYQPSITSSSSSSTTMGGVTSIYLPTIDIDTIHDVKSTSSKTWLMGGPSSGVTATADGYRPPSTKIQELASKALTDQSSSTTTPNTADFVLLTRKGYKSAYNGGRQPNQDRIVMLSRPNNRVERTSSTELQSDLLIQDEDWWIGLFDGHGPLGHCVSQYVSLEFAKRIESEWNTNSNKNVQEPVEEVKESVGEGEEGSESITDKKKPREGSTVAVAGVQNLLTSIFEDINHSMPRFEGSGSTGISVWKRGNMVYLSNVGDSLAFVASYPKNITGKKMEQKDIEIIYETQPHKPDARRERERIEKAGGEVADPPAPGFSARLLIPHPNGIDMTGLAMSRSFGDFEATKYGLIVRPTTMALDLRALNKDKDYILFVVTDGLVDKVQPTQVAQRMAQALIRPKDSNQQNSLLPLEAAEQLILKSSDKWMEDMELEGLYRDDISLVARRLHLTQ